MKRFLALAVLACTHLGCESAPDHPERVDWLRILAVASDPPEAPVGATVTLSTLILDGEGTTPAASHDWFVCQPLVAAQVGGFEPEASLCAEPAGWAPVGTGPDLQLVVPDIGGPPVPGDPFFLPVVVAVERAPETYWALKRIYLSDATPANENPVVATLIIDKVSGTEPVTVAPGTVIPLQIEATDPNGDPIEVEYFVTAGTAEENQAPDPGTRVFWTTPDVEADVTIYAVVRDGRGGTGWLGRQALVRR